MLIMDHSKDDLFRELSALKKQIHELKTSFNKSVTNILAETEVSRPLSTRSTLKVNKESAASMVEIMKEANNIFSTVRDHKTNILNKEIDLKPCSENIDRLKKMSNETADIIGKLDVIKQTIMGFSTHETNDNKPSVSSDLIPGSDPSISEISFFVNSNTNAATSSPIPGFKKNMKKQE